MKSSDIVILKTLQKHFCSYVENHSGTFMAGIKIKPRVYVTTTLPTPALDTGPPLLLRRQIRLRLCPEGELGHLSESTDKFVPNLKVVVIGVSKEGNRLNLR